jgi:radical SAM superfamily enzyme YgiQ (UPF0313 family)
VLTADRMLMAEYPTLLDGMFAASQTTTMSEIAMRLVAAPAVPVRSGRAARAPLGLRMVEAALVDSGIAREDIALVPPHLVKKTVGADTKAVLVSSGDPLGIGMNDSTMAGIDGGGSYTKKWFEGLCADLRSLRTGANSFTVIFGGPGAWQLEQDPDQMARLGIDSVVCGYAEHTVASVVGKALRGETLDAFYHQTNGAAFPTSRILGPTVMGVVEISRGCGLGCPFCTIARQPMKHAPVEKIVADATTNVSGGATSICLISEDFLRYGAVGAALAPDRLLEMADAVRAVPGLRLIQLDHVNASSAARFPADALALLRETLTRGVHHDHLWVNMGVETASGELLSATGCRGKLGPFAAGEWGRTCTEAVERLSAAGFTPMLSLVFGLPGEEPRHLEKTLAFVENLKGRPLTIFPQFYAPVSNGQRAFTVEDMTPLHWRLFRTCYTFNFTWLPRMYWDNHGGAGVSLFRRMLIQSGGMGKALLWKWRLARMARRAAKASSS